MFGSVEGVDIALDAGRQKPGERRDENCYDMTSRGRCR